MNKQLQATLDLSEHKCLSGVSSLYSYPFTRSAFVLEGYEFKGGPWMVLLSNMRPAEVSEDDPGTRKALIEFCPFCGASLYPEPDPEKSPGAELKQEVEYDAAGQARPVQTPSGVSTHRPKPKG